MSGSGPPTGTLRSTKPMNPKPAAFQKIPEEARRRQATIPANPTLRFPAKSSRVARIFARRTIVVVIVPPRATRRRLIHPRATSDFGVLPEAGNEGIEPIMRSHRTVVILIRRVILSALAAFPMLLALPAPAQTGATDPLPSWNDTATKKAIVSFVERVTKLGSSDLVP